MKLLRVEIPNYIRQVKLSNEQQPVYYEYNKGKIKAKNKELPDKYLIDWADGVNMFPQYLRFGYRIGIFRGNVMQGILTSVAPDFAETIQWVVRDTELRKSHLSNPQKYLLIDDACNKIVANNRVVGTPRIITIRGQDLFNSKVREHVRGTVMQEIKKSFIPFVKDIDKIPHYPVRIKCYLFDTVKNVFDNTKDVNVSGQRWDVGNRIYPYSKAFLDLLSTGKSGEKDGDNPIIHFEPKLIDDDRLHVTEDPQGGVFCPIDSNEVPKLVFIIGKDDRYFNRELRGIERERRLLIEKSQHYGTIERR